MRISGILLAAGASSRLGQPKQLLDFRGKPLVRHVAEQALASQLDRLVVVIAQRSDEVRPALDGLDVVVAENPAYRDGQSTSLRAGLMAAAASDAAVVLLVDTPLVDSALIDRLIEAYQQHHPLIVAPRFDGRRGNPVLFDRAVFPELLAITGDTGARDVVQKHRTDLRTVELDDEGPFRDIDTWDDYKSIQAM